MEQRKGIDQISRALVDIDSVTRSNAEDSDLMAQTSEQLNGQTEDLRTRYEDWMPLSLVRNNRVGPLPQGPAIS